MISTVQVSDYVLYLELYYMRCAGLESSDSASAFLFMEAAMRVVRVGGRRCNAVFCFPPSECTV